MTEERTFVVGELKTALDNYRQQLAAADKQHQELSQQLQMLQETHHMLTGAILALEALLKTPATNETENG